MIVSWKIKFSSNSPLGKNIIKNYGKEEFKAGNRFDSLYMGILSAAENEYWSKNFYQKSYYVPGRSYDQYQPAFEIGWQTALTMPDVSFSDAQAQLEQAWMRHESASLLTWREVQGAVKDAWEHASQHMANVQSRMTGSVEYRAGSVALRTIYKKSLNLVGQLKNLEGLQKDSFVQQVLQRHHNLIINQIIHLEKYVNIGCANNEGIFLNFSAKLQSNWSYLKKIFSRIDIDNLFLICEIQEKDLVVQYEQALMDNYPEELRNLLERHLKELENNVDKLSWVRRNWHG